MYVTNEKLDGFSIKQISLSYTNELPNNEIPYLIGILIFIIILIFIAMIVNKIKKHKINILQALLSKAPFLLKIEKSLLQ